MALDWLPGAHRSPQSGGVTLDKSLPARATWHITWDALNNGQRPQFSAVSSYLKRVKYCPHIMWDPFTGYVEQYYPASVGGRALGNWNQDGEVHIQVEVFFSPGTVYGGKKYATVEDTPCVGLDKIIDWMRSHGIKDGWPGGEPRWAPWPTPNSGNSRNVTTWNSQSGHYGHSQVPGDSHTDPGPMPDMFGTRAKPAATPKPKESQEDDVPRNIYNAFSGDQKLEAGKWKTVKCTREGYITHLAGNEATHSINFTTFTFKNLPKGAEVHARYLLVDYEKGRPTKVVNAFPYEEIVGTGGATQRKLIAPVNLEPNNRFRLRIQLVTYSDGVIVDRVHTDSYTWKA